LQGTTLKSLSSQKRIRIHSVNQQVQELNESDQQNYSDDPHARHPTKVKSRVKNNYRKILGQDFTDFIPMDRLPCRKTLFEENLCECCVQ
jgi:hypothetical protein